MKFILYILTLSVLVGCSRHRFSQQSDQNQIQLPKFSVESKKIIDKYYHVAIAEIDSPEEYFLYRFEEIDDAYRMVFYPLNLLQEHTKKKGKSFTFNTGSIWIIELNTAGKVVKTNYVE